MHQITESAQSRAPRPALADRMPASVSTPLADTQFYRPGPVLALGILMLPPGLTLGLAVLALTVGGTVPPWLPVLALLGLPAAPLLWLLMQSARTTSAGIAVARPWRTWTGLRWDEIERVSQRGIILRISGRGERLVIAPRLLLEGARLRRQLLLRLPPHALSVRLSREAEVIASSGFAVLPDGSVAGSVVASPRTRYAAVLLVSACALGAAAGGAVWLGSTTSTPSPAIPVAGAIAVALALVCLASAAWLAQRVALDERGITIVRALAAPRQRQRFFAWDQIKMVEYTPHMALLRIRDSHLRALCSGPGLCDAERATIMWALIQSHCAGREVLVIQRRRLPS